MTKKTAVTIEFDAEKLKAARFYAKKKDALAEAELTDCLQKFYEKYVPAQTREYLENSDEAESQARQRTERANFSVSRSMSANRPSLPAVAAGGVSEPESSAPGL